MAKNTNSDATLGYEAELWRTADALCGSMDAAEYKHVVLGLMFLKDISDAFEEHRARLEEEPYADPEDPDEYRAQNVFWVPPEARWERLRQSARQPTIGQVVDQAMEAVERDNPALKGVLPKDYAHPALDKQRLGQLIDLVSNIRVGDAEARAKDVLGRVYEYFLGQFASKEGKKGGEFYTPPSVVRLLVEMLEPYQGRVYDPCCGSAGMFVQSVKFIEAHATGNEQPACRQAGGGRARAQISIYGQERNYTTWRLAKMNLAIRGIDGQIEHGDTFHNDRHPDLKADFILANPPFNVSDWGGERLRDDKRWPYGRQYERDPDWKLPSLAAKYPRCSTDRETAETNNLEWVTPGHPLFEALRRHTYAQALHTFSKGATFYSLQHDKPARIDFYRAHVVDGLGQVIHERLFAVEIRNEAEPRLCEPNILGNFTPAPPPAARPEVAEAPEVTAWLHEHALAPFLEETRKDRLAEIERIAEHVELSLTELLQRADEEIGRAQEAVDRGEQGAEGRLVQAEARHDELLQRRERRRKELEQQRSLTLQGVERIASVLVLPHPEREAPEVQRLQPNPETEATAMRVVMEYERAQGRQVYDVHEKNLGYDITSLDLNSGELRLIEVKGLAGSTGTIVLTPNERRVAEDRRDCYWLYVVSNCATNPQLQEPIRDPARLHWHEVTKVAHYYLSLDTLTRPMEVWEDQPPDAAPERRASRP